MRNTTIPLNPALSACVALLGIVWWATIPVAAIAQTDSEPSAVSLTELKEIGARKSKYLRPSSKPLSSNSTPTPSMESFRRDVQPILHQACVDCHGADTQEGKFRVDVLDPDLLHGDDVNWWVEVVDVLSRGEMPPPDEAEMEESDRGKVIEWLSSELQVASAYRRAQQGHSSFRRMSGYEYNYALQDLLELPYDFAKDLPPESTSEDGFQNSSEMLHMSSIQFAQYREVARDALQRATVRGEQPDAIHWNISMKQASAKFWRQQQDELEKVRKRLKDDPEKLEAELQRRTEKFRVNRGATHYRNLATNQTARASWNYRAARYAWTPTDSESEVPPPSDHVVILPAGQTLIIELGNQVPDEGWLRVRIRAARIDADDEQVPSMQMEFGWQASNNSSASTQIKQADIAVDAEADDPQWYQWEVPLSEIYPRNPMRRTAAMGDTPSPSEYIKLRNSSASRVGIQIDHVEVTAPVYDDWPPSSHRKVFFESDNSHDEAAYAAEVLSTFMTRAWRRPVTDAEVEQKLALLETIRPQCDDLQQAMVEVLATVLSSPKFLYLTQSSPASDAESDDAHRISDHELASRLAIFLWCSLPDDELRSVAANGQLRKQEVLAQQVNRMLTDPRSQRFSKHFVRGWLGMQLLDYLDVDRKTHRQFDEKLKEAMQREPIAFFEDVLRNDASVLDFLHSDYTMVNERLALHYGIPGVYGHEFRRVALDPSMPRGGLLTQSGLLAMNSDGTDSHPLKRGIWLLESLLNDPPPPPPPAVPEIDLADPEIAKMTLKQRIENHRDQAACRSCHAKIDPWGIAFENFDAVGRWRDDVAGEPVDASSFLFNGQPLDGMDGLKRYLLQHRQDQFVRAMVHKLASYALGRPLTFGDRSSLDKITAEVRRSGDGLATMITRIATSEMFQSQ